MYLVTHIELLFPRFFQDYLNNPMFDSLHQRRRYWPGEGSGGVGGDTIKLRPLSHLTKRNVISAHKRLPPMGRNSCKVL